MYDGMMTTPLSLGGCSRPNIYIKIYVCGSDTMLDVQLQHTSELLLPYPVDLILPTRISHETNAVTN